MWKNIIISMILLILIIFFALIIRREYKKSDNYTQTLTIALCFSAFITFLMYIFDLYNIPTKIGLANLNYDKWFSFVLTGISSFMATMISVTFVTINTDKQLNQQEINNNKKEVNDNMPYFIYDLNPNVSDDLGRSKYTIDVGEEKIPGKYGHIKLIFENVGVGNAKNVKINIKTKDYSINDKCINNYESFIAKGDKKYLKIQFHMPLDKQNIVMTITYEDIKGNMYKQKINVYTTSTIYEETIELDDNETKIYPPESMSKKDLS